jgi:hypothetical protein
MIEKKTSAETQPVITSFKGLTHEFKCRKFQFEVGKTYSVSGGVKACSSGFHACENPLDVWGYYPIIDDDGRLTRYAEVEQSGSTDRENDIIASAFIIIKAELKFGEFITRAVKWLCDKAAGENNSSGASAQIGSSGNSAQIGSSGGFAQIGSSGDSARIASSSSYARIASEGDNAVIASAGENTIITVKKGAWVSLAEFSNGKCIGFATGCIEKDGTYKASGGKLVEVQP